jgi:ATP-dependent protease ClpP protease subunit
VSLFPGGFADAPVLIFSGLLLVWQVVGGWRNASRIMRESGDLAISVALYSGVVLVIILATVQLVDQVSKRYLLPVDLSRFETELLETRLDGQVIVIQGPLSYTENTSLKATLKVFASAQTVLLESDGGNIFAARALALTIAENGLATRVDGMCFSACTLAFMAGAPRDLGPKGQLGFHGYAFDSILRLQTVDVKEQEAEDREFFAEQGLSNQFIDRIFATPPAELWRPNRADLIVGGVIDG